MERTDTVDDVIVLAVLVPLNGELVETTEGPAELVVVVAAQGCAAELVVAVAGPAPAPEMVVVAAVAFSRAISSGTFEPSPLEISLPIASNFSSDMVATSFQLGVMNTGTTTTEQTIRQALCERCRAKGIFRPPCSGRLLAEPARETRLQRRAEQNGRSKAKEISQ